MVENVKLKIIELHEEILDIIDNNVGTLVNFDWHSDFPLYPDIIFDADIYSNTVLKNYDAWLDNNWVPILVNRGCMSKYIWMYPHDCGKDEIKKFKAKKGDCEVYSIKFQNITKMPYKCITIDAGFFGTRVPFNWSPKDRMGLFIDVFASLTARNIMMIFAKSKHYVNYNVEEFLEDIINEMSNRANIEEVL
jgi:hypothetical protein